MVHCDVCGKITPQSNGGVQYLVTMYDDCTALSSVKFMKRKDETIEKLKKMIEKLEAASKQYRIRDIRMENGGNIYRRKSEVGLAIGEFTLTSLHHTRKSPMGRMKGFTESDWTGPGRCYTSPETVWRRICAPMLYALTTILEAGYTPGPAGIRPDLSILREFGCKSVSFIPRKRRTAKKFEPRGEEGIVARYSTGGAYNIYIPSSGKLRLTKDVHIIETGNCVDMLEPTRELTE